MGRFSIGGRSAKCTKYAEKPIIFGNALASAGGARFDKGGVHGDGNIGKGRILRFSRTVRKNKFVAVILCHFNHLHRFGERSDLVWLDQNGIGCPHLHSAFEPC